jgi:hypothetical protein
VHARRSVGHPVAAGFLVAPAQLCLISLLRHIKALDSRAFFSPWQKEEGGVKIRAKKNRSSERLFLQNTRSIT